MDGQLFSTLTQRLLINYFIFNSYLLSIVSAQVGCSSSINWRAKEEQESQTTVDIESWL